MNADKNKSNPYLRLSASICGSKPLLSLIKPRSQLNKGAADENEHDEPVCRLCSSRAQPDRNRIVSDDQSAGQRLQD
jgi:hypothetical protein